MFWYIYHLPLEVIMAAMCAAVPLWALMMWLIARKSSKAVMGINAVLSFVSLTGIAYITLLRATGGKSELVLIPFHSFIEAREQVEMYRSMLMNVALFTPLGMTLPFLMIRKRKPVAKAVLIALALTVSIEALQFIFCLGRCETDDVLCNTLGAAVGSLSYFLFQRLPGKAKIPTKNKVYK